MKKRVRVKLFGRRVIAITCIIVGTCQYCLSQAMEYYSAVRVGDVVGLYQPETAQILVFADELTCWTCIESIPSLVKVTKGTRLPFTVFRKGKESLEGSSFPPEVKVIEDRLGAYHSYYGVRNSGVLLVVGRTGRVEFIGTPGKASFSVQEFAQAVSKVTSTALSTSTNGAHQSSITLMKSIPTTVRVSFAPAIDYLDSAKQIAILSQHNRLSVIDTNGKTIREKNLTGRIAGKVTVSTPVLAGEIIVDGRPMIAIADAHPISLDAYVLAYDVTSDSLHFVSEYAGSIADNQYVSWINSFNDTRMMKGLSVMYDLRDQDVDTLRPLLLCDYGERTYGRFGNLDSFYIRSYLNAYDRVSFGVTDDREILAVSMLGLNLFRYDSLGVYKGVTKVRYDTTCWDYRWMQDAESFTSKTSIENIMALQKKVTMITDSRLLIDRETSEIVIPLLKASDGIDGRLRVDYFIHRIRTDGMQATYPLAADARPLFVRNSILCTLTEKSDTFTLQFFRLP